jgi:hypothetical protein
MLGYKRLKTSLADHQTINMAVNKNILIVNDTQQCTEHLDMK